MGAFGNLDPLFERGKKNSNSGSECYCEGYLAFHLEDRRKH